MLGLAFLVMYLASQQAKSGRVSPLWLISVYFIFTVAELFVSPIGLSLVNKLAHPAGRLADDGRSGSFAPPPRTISPAIMEETLEAI